MRPRLLGLAETDYSRPTTTVEVDSLLLARMRKP